MDGVDDWLELGETAVADLLWDLNYLADGRRGAGMGPAAAPDLSRLRASDSALSVIVASAYANGVSR